MLREVKTSVNIINKKIWNIRQICNRHDITEILFKVALNTITLTYP